MKPSNYNNKEDTTDIITIASLVPEVEKIYLDNSIFAIEERSSYNLKPNGEKYYETKSLADILGAAKSYSDVPERALRRFYNRAEALSNLILGSSKFTACEAAIEEFRPLVRHLNYQAKSLHQKSSSTRLGHKEKLLRGSAERYNDMLAILNGRLSPLIRSYEEDTIQQIIEFIYDKSLHQSHDRKWVKRQIKVENKPSKADAEVSAITLLWSSQNEGKTALLTGDLDIVNIIRNYIRIQDKKNIPLALRHIKASNVHVYLPAPHFWDRELRLEQAWPAKRTRRNDNHDQIRAIPSEVKESLKGALEEIVKESSKERFKERFEESGSDYLNLKSKDHGPNN